MVRKKYELDDLLCCCNNIWCFQADEVHRWTGTGPHPSITNIMLIGLISTQLTLGQNFNLESVKHRPWTFAGLNRWPQIMTTVAYALNNHASLIKKHCFNYNLSLREGQPVKLRTLIAGHKESNLKLITFIYCWCSSQPIIQDGMLIQASPELKSCEVNWSHVMSRTSNKDICLCSFVHLCIPKRYATVRCESWLIQDVWFVQELTTLQSNKSVRAWWPKSCAAKL